MIVYLPSSSGRDSRQYTVLSSISTSVSCVEVDATTFVVMGDFQKPHGEGGMIITPSSQFEVLLTPT